MNIRQAKVSDLPVIHSLITNSFLAMLEHTGEEMRDRWEKGALDSISGDLSAEKFENTYLEKYGCNFWVSSQDDVVQGCVALKRTSQDEAELLRMAVDPSIRSKGIGGTLVASLLAYAKETGVTRISLVTANPLAAKFYSKNNFATFHSFQYPYALNKYLTVSRMVYYLAEKVIRNVHVIGGTHGNEKIGVELVKLWEANPLHRSTLNVKCLLGNVDAVNCNRRYVDVDLNRQFLSSDLSIEPVDDDKIEVKRAHVLNQILGPKSSVEKNCGSDFVIDLHSSNSNVGLCCMISGENDVVALRIAYKLQEKFPELKVTCSTGGKDTSWSLDSISENGLSIEVGPLPHGTLQFDLLDKTRSIVLQIIDELDRRNIELMNSGKLTTSFGREVVYADHASNQPSTIAPIDNFKSIDIFTSVQRVTYPESDIKYIIHPDIEGKDWLPINLSNKVLISINGEVELCLRDVVNIKDFKEDENYYPLFINEAAYVESNVAFAIYAKKEKYIP